MKKKYNHREIESKWQRYWLEQKTNKAEFPSAKPKCYCLIEFPYPSGDGLHVGHPRPYIGLDIIARKRRMEGFNVLYPIGWDAFGLPTENYAIKTGIPPAVVTKKNTDNFRRQIQSLGISFDWSREINTTDPAYYKWTQWIFLQFYKQGLAYKKKQAINWCPQCLIGLANEEVVSGACERCGAPVEQKEKEQWMLAITKYADRLDRDLDTVDYRADIKLQQRHWIGRSEGAEMSFELEAGSVKLLPPDSQLRTIPIFTTRPDTIFGVTFVAISQEFAKNQLHLEVQLPSGCGDETEKLGMDTGLKAINPASGEAVPVWVVNYVLDEVGTGAIMGVPAHDERDLEFAKKYNLPIVEKELVPADEIIRKFGQPKTSYKLRDWVFSRQRYWGEPIPMIWCEKCALNDTVGQGWQPVPEKDLPVELPPVEKYQPTETGESPLAAISDWVNTTCPRCDGPARRETDTMPNWAGSSWYYLAYAVFDPKAKGYDLKAKSSLDYWLPVDWYNGGMEHTTLHLLYSRFWHKFLFDQKLVPTSEPYRKRSSHGLILAEGGAKMSKSKGNVINPDEIVKNYGADTLRVYEMFMGPFDQAISWSADGLMGPRRFLEKVWRLAEREFGVTEPALGSLLEQTIKKVGEDIEELKFNTAISALMVLVKAMAEAKTLGRAEYQTLLRLLSPFAPHLTQELWANLGEGGLIGESHWPDFDAAKISSERKIIVQINGIKRAELTLISAVSDEVLTTQARDLPAVQKWLKGSEAKRVVIVPGKLVNFVV